MKLDSPVSGTPSNTSGSSDDVFSNFLSAPPASISPNHDKNQSPGKTGEVTTTTENTTTTTTTTRSAEEESFFNQSTINTEKKLSKDSILALYGSSNVPNQNAATMYNNAGTLINLVLKVIIVIIIIIITINFFFQVYTSKQ